CCRAARDKYHKGIAEFAAVGSSNELCTAGRMSAAASGWIGKTTCWQPICSATARAACVSSMLEPGNAAVKALKLEPEVRAMAAVIAPESTPPDRKAPTGT